MKAGKNSTSQPIKIKLRSYLESRQSPEYWINQIYTVSDEQVGNDTIIFRKDHTIYLKNLLSGKWKTKQGIWQLAHNAITIVGDWINWRGQGFSFQLHDIKPETYTHIVILASVLNSKRGCSSRKPWERSHERDIQDSLESLTSLLTSRLLIFTTAASRLSGLTALRCSLVSNGTSIRLS